MISTYRFIGTTEGRKNGLLQMKRLVALLRKQGYHNIKVTEKKMPGKTLAEMTALGFNIYDWWGKSFFKAEVPTTYFEVTFCSINKSPSTTTNIGSPVR